MIEQRLRAIETGEWMEKLHLAELVGGMPPIGANFIRGESTQDLQNRAARAGIHLPGAQRPAVRAIIDAVVLERQKGITVYASPVKARYAIAQALDGQSAWEIPDLVEYDFSMINIAAASTIPGLTLGLVPGTNAPLIGSPDGLDPATSGADTASRKSGTGSKKYMSILSVWVFSRTSAGAVYTAAAGTTMQPFVISAAPASAAQLSTALSAAALAINGLTNFWNQITLVAPADRQISKGSPTDPQAGIVASFWGDVIASVLVVTGALNVQGNSIDMIWELA